MVLSGDVGGAFVVLGSISSPAALRGGGGGPTFCPNSSVLPYFHIQKGEKLGSVSTLWV